MSNTKTGMPYRMTFVRHGESDANIVNKAIKNKTLADYPEGYRERIDREFRLSDKGRDQAKVTGNYLYQNYDFDHIFVSDFVRAQETAGIACREAGWDEGIRVEPMLGERSWGSFNGLTTDEQDEAMRLKKRNPLHFFMPGGESMLFTRIRARSILEKMYRQFTGDSILLFTHGEFIEAMMAEIFHMNTEEQVEFFHSSAGDIKNCHIVSFISNIITGKLVEYVTENPYFEIERVKLPIPRRMYTAQELIDKVEKYPKLDHSYEK